jgi:Tfp pilus assembly protein FimT
MELIVVLGMMSILAAMAVTSLSSEGSKLRAAAYNLRTELLSAKAEAIKRNQTAIINFNNATNSYQASIDGNTLFKSTLPREVNLSYSDNEFKFTALSTAFPNNGNVTLSSVGKEYKVQINACGQVTITHVK